MDKTILKSEKLVKLGAQKLQMEIDPDYLVQLRQDLMQKLWENKDQKVKEAYMLREIQDHYRHKFEFITTK